VDDQIKDEMDGHMTGMGEKRNACRVLERKPEGRRMLGRIGVGGRIILKWILEK
jgi:hypothetical protein